MIRVTKSMEVNQPIKEYESDSLKHHDITQRIIGVFYEVYNILGHGFLEKIYQHAMELRLTKAGYKVTSQQPIQVHFDGQVIGGILRRSGSGR